MRLVEGREPEKIRYYRQTVETSTVPIGPVNNSDIDAEFAEPGETAAAMEEISCRGGLECEISLDSQNEIDLHSLNDLESVAKELTVPKETLQRWVAAGILSPNETKIAERLIKLMRENDRRHPVGLPERFS